MVAAMAVVMAMAATVVETATPSLLVNKCVCAREMNITAVATVVATTVGATAPVAPMVVMAMVSTITTAVPMAMAS